MGSKKIFKSPKNSEKKLKIPKNRQKKIFFLNRQKIVFQNNFAFKTLKYSDEICL